MQQEKKYAERGAKNTMNQSNKIYKKDRLNEDRDKTWLRNSQPGFVLRPIWHIIFDFSRLRQGGKRK
jgi:hypothetical protein